MKSWTERSEEKRKQQSSLSGYAQYRQVEKRPLCMTYGNHENDEDETINPDFPKGLAHLIKEGK